MSGPPPGVGGGGPPGGAAGGPPSPEQIALMKEAGVRGQFASDIGMSMGPYILGYAADLIMLGILVAQVWHWYTWTKGERWFLRVLVYWVLFWCCFSSVFAFNWFDYLLVEHYGKYAQFVDNSWFQWFNVIAQAVLVACQIFNLDRAYRLHHKKIWVILVVVPFMLAAVGAVIGIKIKTASGSEFSGGAIMIRPFMYVYLSSMLVTDILITAIIAHGLWKSKTGWKHTDAMIKRVIMFSAEAQFPPAITALAMLITFVVQPDTFVSFFFMICYAKVPAIAFMAVLNFRFSLRKDRNMHQLSTAGLDRQADAFNGRMVGNADGGGGFQADSDSIPMVPYKNQTQLNSTDWQPPLLEKNFGRRV